MFLGILLLGTTELYTVFKKGSSWTCTFRWQKLFTQRAWSSYVTSPDLFSLLLLTLLLGDLMHVWIKNLLNRFLLLLLYYRYCGNSASSFSNILIPCPSTVDPWWLNLITGYIRHHWFWIRGLRICLQTQFWLPGIGSSCCIASLPHNQKCNWSVQ